MEALSLLCTLHADGPATVKRLRLDGCSSLEQLEAYDPERLAGVLGIAPAVARRLGKEARVLRSRLGQRETEEVLLDREEVPEPLFRSSPAATPDAQPSATGLERGDRALLQRVLGRWAAEDDAPRAPQALPMIERRVPAATAATSDAEPVTAPEPEPLPVRPMLAAGALEGLDGALASQLADAEIGSLRALADADCRALAKRTGQSFPRLRRLQFLARRAASEQDPGERIVERAEELAAAPPTPMPTSASTPATEDLTPAPRPLGERPWIAAPTSGPLAPSTPVTEPQVAPRRFWEPRKFWEERTVAPDEPAASDPALVSDEEKITLDWNFEIPTPPSPAPRPLEMDDAAGPFA